MKKCCGVHALRIVVRITMLVLLLASSANAATITVNASGGEEYKKIQDAIDNASNGDTILVSGGATTTLTYYENVNVNKQLILRGIGNPVVDARGRGSAITLAANGITLEEFTATGSGYQEAGIKVTSNNNKLSGNNVNSNNFNGISLYDSSNNTLMGNNASNNNIYGISLGGSNNKIYNNIFKNNNSIVYSDGSNINVWNITRQSGTNIIGGSYIGGNFWANPNGNGFSQICPDVNGDGICDQSYFLNWKNIDYLPLSMNFTKDKIPPKSVRNLKNITYARNYINWTWKDPKDVDFKKVMVFIDSKFKKNVSKSKRYYNANNFTANTRHTISTWTVDMNGNINKTWTNSSAWTAK